MDPSFPLHSPLGDRCAWALLHTVWQGGVIAAVLAGGTAIIRPRRAATRYAFTLTALVLFLLCPVATCLLVEAPQRIGSDSASSETLGVDVDLQSDAHGGRLHMLLGDEALSSEPIDAGAFEPNALIADRPARYIPPERSEHVSSAATEGEDGAQWRQLWFRVQPFVLTIWLAGVLLLSLRLARSGVAMLRLRWDRDPADGELACRTARLAAALGLRTAPRVFLSRRAAEAVVTGYLRPLILLPASWATELPSDVLNAVIAHELAHIRRHDLWTILLQRLAETLLFFHPAVWWLSRRLSRERELCCDALAVDAVGSAAGYAAALEHVAHRLREWDSPGRMDYALTPTIGGQKMELLHRVRHVLGLADPPPRRTTPLPHGLVLAIVPTVLVTTSLAFVSAPSEKPSPRTAASAGDTANEPPAEAPTAPTEEQLNVAAPASKEPPAEEPIAPGEAAGIVNGRLNGLDAPLTDDHLQRLQNRVDLRSLLLRGEEITAAGLRSLQECHRLEELGFVESRLNAEMLEVVAKLPALRRLAILHCELEPDALQALAPLKDEVSLLIEEDAVSRAELERTLGNVARLARVELNDVVLSARAGTQAPFADLDSAPDRELEHASAEDRPALEQLAELGAWVSTYRSGAIRNSVRFEPQTPFSPRAVELLENLSADLSLTIRSIDLTDEHLAGLQRIEALRFLDLRGPRITDAGLRHLIQLRRVEGLHLFGSQVTDAGMTHVAAMPAIRRVFLYESRVTDAGIATLCEIPALKGLGAANCALTPVCLASIREASELETLQLSGCPLSAEEIGSLAGLSKLMTARFTLAENPSHDAAAAGDAALAACGRFGALTDLTLENATITREGLRRLDAAQTLQTVELVNSSIASIEEPGLGSSRLEARSLRLTSLYTTDRHYFCGKHNWVGSRLKPDAIEGGVMMPLQPDEELSDDAPRSQRRRIEHWRRGESSEQTVVWVVPTGDGPVETKDPIREKPSGESKLREDELRRALIEKCEVSFVDVPLEEALESIGDRYLQGRLRLSRGQIRSVGAAPETPVSLVISGISVRSALALILAPLDLDWMLVDGHVEVTSRWEAENQPQSGVYPVFDLLGPKGEELDEQESREAAAGLARLIRSTIEPDTWEGQGGHGQIVFHPSTHSLVLRNSRRVLDQVSEQLTALRWLQQQAAGNVGADPDANANRQFWRTLGDASSSDLQELPGSEEVHRIRETLLKRVSVDWREVPLNNVLAAISQKQHLNIALDNAGLSEVGTAADAPVTLTLHDVSLATVLQQIVEPLGLAWRHEHEVIMISSRQQVSGPLKPVSYPVRDFIANEAAPRAELERLAEVLTQVIAPDDWSDRGGVGSISVHELSSSLVVQHTPAVHAQIARLLQDLSAARGDPGRDRPAAPTLPFPPRDPAVQLALESVIVKEATTVTLDELPQHVRKAAGINLVVDGNSLLEAGVKGNEEIRLSPEQHHLLAALTRGLRPLGLGVIVDGELALVVSLRRAAGEVSTRVYQLGGWLEGKQPIFGSLREAAEHVKASLDHSTWTSSGGWGAIEIDAPSQSLIIRHSARHHSQIADELDRLRRGRRRDSL